MAWVPDFGFCGESYTPSSLLLEAQDSMNLMPEPGLATSKAKFALVNAPGLIPFATLPAGPVRALWSDYQALWACAGSQVHQINPSSGAIIQTFNLSGIGFSTGGHAQMVSNGVQLLISDWPTGVIVSINMQTGSQISPGIHGPPGYAAIEYLDGYFFALDANTTNGVLQSAPLDGTTWPGLNTVQRTGSADRLVMLAEINRQLLMLGVKKTEIWFDAGNPQFALQSGGAGTTIDVGVMVPQSVVKLGNTLVWLAADARGSAQVIMLDGSQPVRISNYGIEYFIKEFLTTNYTSLSAFSYQENGHLFYVLNLQDKTIVYDLTTKMWHKRGYWTGSAITRARQECFTSVNDGTRTHSLVGDYASGTIYEQGIDGYQNGTGGSMFAYRTSPHVSRDDQWLTHHELDVFCTNMGPTGPALDYSDDGGYTYINQQAMVQETVSSPQDTNNYVWYRARQLGMSRDRVYRLELTPAVAPFAIINARLDVT